MTEVALFGFFTLLGTALVAPATLSAFCKAVANLAAEARSPALGKVATTM